MRGFEFVRASFRDVVVNRGNRPWRFLLRLLLFVTTYLSVRSLIEWITPFQVGSEHLSAKLSILEREKVAPSVFFIGSSRTHYHFNPSLFDSVVSKGGGVGVRSFNLSQGDVSEFESVHIARQLLNSGKAPACRTIFIEFYYKRPETEWVRRDKGIERFYHRMDPGIFLFHAGAILRSKEWGYARKTEELLWLSRIIALRYFGVGRYRSLLMGTGAWRISPLAEVRGRGFQPIDSQFAHLSEKELRPLRESIDTNLIRTKIQRIRNQENWSSDSSLPVMGNYFLDFIREASQRGVRVIYIVQPMLFNLSIPPPVPDSLSGNIIDLTDPDVYPELYDWTNYFDFLHLKASGSNMVTVCLAEEYLARTVALKSSGQAALER